MKTYKKVIAGVMVTALIAGAASAGAMYIKKSNEAEVMVVSVGSIASDYYMQDTYLDGTVTSSVSQTVTVDKDMVVKDVAVQKGDTVKKGDTLITFDMTLVQMELNIAKLKKQQQEQELNKAVNRLKSLQNGGPIIEEDSTLPPSSDDELNSTTVDDEASAAAELKGSYLAAAVNPVLLAASISDVFSDDSSSSGADDSQTSDSSSYGEEELPSSDDMDMTGETTDAGSGSAEQGDSTFSSGEDFISGENDPPLATPTPIPDTDEDVDYLDQNTSQEESPFHDGNPTFYDKLDGDSIPYTGRGSEEEPYVFLCSAATGKVTVTGEFLNKMAGFSEDGTRVLNEKGYWYQLEFHNRDTITNFEDRTESCIGYYLINGLFLESPVNSLVEMEFTVDEASQYHNDDEELPDDPGDPGSGGSGSTTTLTRAEAIKQKQSLIASLKLDIQESDINISKLEKKVQKEVIYSKIDGTVSYVGDPATSSESAYLVVKSNDGYFVKGTVSELMLDQVEEGTILNCESYQYGSFEAEVVDVSEYPVSSDGGYYYGEGNPNVSYYTYTASVTDKSLKLSDQDWLTVTLQNQNSVQGSIVLDKAFVLTENGISYVYKDDNGVLKKQALTVGGNVNGGYSVLIKGGITREDKIAFPYGSSVQEGVKTREGTLDELYGY